MRRCKRCCQSRIGPCANENDRNVSASGCMPARGLLLTCKDRLARQLCHQPGNRFGKIVGRRGSAWSHAGRRDRSAPIRAEVAPSARGRRRATSLVQRQGGHRRTSPSSALVIVPVERRRASAVRGKVARRTLLIRVEWTSTGRRDTRCERVGDVGREAASVSRWRLGHRHALLHGAGRHTWHISGRCRCRRAYVAFLVAARRCALLLAPEITVCNIIEIEVRVSLCKSVDGRVYTPNIGKYPIRQQ